MMRITMQSMLTGRMNSMDLPVTQEAVDAWRSGDQLITTAFPTLTKEQREFLMTGSSPEEWTDLFGEEE